MLLCAAMFDGPDGRAHFERVYQKYRYLMLHVAGRILQDHQDAEDAVQEAFIAVIRNIDIFSDVEDPRTRSLVWIDEGTGVAFTMTAFLAPEEMLRIAESVTQAE